SPRVALPSVGSSTAVATWACSSLAGAAPSPGAAGGSVASVRVAGSNGGSPSSTGSGWGLQAASAISTGAKNRGRSCRMTVSIQIPGKSSLYPVGCPRRVIGDRDLPAGHAGAEGGGRGAQHQQGAAGDVVGGPTAQHRPGNQQVHLGDAAAVGEDPARVRTDVSALLEAFQRVEERARAAGAPQRARVCGRARAAAAQAARCRRGERLGPAGGSGFSELHRRGGPRLGGGRHSPRRRARGTSGKDRGGDQQGWVHG